MPNRKTNSRQLLLTLLVPIFQSPKLNGNNKHPFCKEFRQMETISKFGITEVANCNQFAFDKLPEPLQNFTFYHITDVKATRFIPRRSAINDSTSNRFLCCSRYNQWLTTFHQDKNKFLPTNFHQFGFQTKDVNQVIELTLRIRGSLNV